MNPFSSLRIRLMVTVLIAITPAWLLMYFTELPWTGFLMGLLALGAAWFGGERFVLRQVRIILDATRKLAAGDLTARTGLTGARGELAELARTVDQMAESLQARVRQTEEAERTLLNRALQQSSVAAIGQYALITNDFNALLEQAAMLAAHTLGTEFSCVLELQPDGKEFLMRAGVGWRDGCVGAVRVPIAADTLAGFTLSRGEPVVIPNHRADTRFKPWPLLTEHGAVSGISVAVATRHQPYGALAVFTSQPRQFTGDEVHFMLSVATALALAAERKRAEAELQKLATFAQQNPNAAMELSPDGRVTYFNTAAAKLAEAVGQKHPSGLLPPEAPEIIRQCLATGRSRTRLETRLGQRVLSWAFHPVSPSGVVHCYVEDITERLNLEAQLRQSQKMESIGQLAAGVAHDFNNMLTVIKGHAGMLLARPNLGPELFESAQAIYFASERAASLTRQLLMFSRKNIMQRKYLDLREVIGNMTKMLQRLLGETIALEYRPPADLPAVFADAGMIEQVIMNLAVNARDAMPQGGRLTLDVSEVEIGETEVLAHPDSRPGRFVCLRVTDTGIGMDTEIISRIFEPFFTTKEVGKGTGLGLATVYGIVKQHEGWIEVTSQVGKGSTFRVFLPASDTAAAGAEKADTDPMAFVRGGHETVLVVEDEPVLRDMAQMILEELGYRVLSAGTGREALGVWEQHNGRVDLLLTDMVMPEGVSGVELAKQMLARQPDLRVVFTSGYTVDDVSEAFLARTNARFLQKPYTRTTLAQAVRRALDQRPASAPA
jgi:signal transduction histidine kinase/ActR/RegA family two-component response regulator/HAMP domain-containing protein